MSSSRPAGALLFLVLTGLQSLRAQYVPEPRSFNTGIETRYYDLGPNLVVSSLGQFAMPFTFVLPAGRFVFDVGTWLASTSLSRYDGFRETVNGITDTQVRAAYVLGSDAVVLSALVNLPTGKQDLTVTEYAVVAAASSSFFAFPVNAYSTGASLTLGAAGAFEAGEWNIGLAASLRLSDEYEPFDDPAGRFTYKSGLEYRLRGGADRLVGNGRFSLGLTYSTFSTDQFSSGGGTTGVYRPGRRVIGEVAYSALAGPATVTGYVWDYYRTSGDSAGIPVNNRENLFASGVVALLSIKPTLFFEPGAEFRWYAPEEGSALMLELSAAFRIRMSSRFTLVPVGRVHFGRLQEPEPGLAHSIRGGGLSVLLRWSW